MSLRWSAARRLLEEDEGWQCDGCGEGLAPGCEIVCCEPCDFDLCQACALGCESAAARRAARRAARSRGMGIGGRPPYGELTGMYVPRVGPHLEDGNLR